MNFNSNNKGLGVLKEAFQEIDKWEYENLHLEALEEVIPSPAYIKRMERLMKWQKRSCWKYVNTVGKRIAMIAVVIALAFGLSMSVSAVREPVVKFFVHIYERFVEFFYDDDVVTKAPDTIETVYTLGYVPEGYELESCNIADIVTRMVWVNDAGEKIVFSQKVLTANDLIDYENADYEIVYLKETKILFVRKNNKKSYYWNSEEYFFTLIFPIEMSEEGCSASIESIVLYGIE